MKKQMAVTQSILWAAAMIAAAIMKAPVFFTIVLLPVLAATSLVAIDSICRRSAGRALACNSGSKTSL